MKRALVLVLALTSISPLLAQQTASKQPQTIQMECRDLSPTGNVGPDETIINGKACHMIREATQPTEPVSNAYDPQSATSVPPPTASANTPEATPPSDSKIRVFVTDSQSWETRGGSSAGGNRNAWGAHSWMAGGARPQTGEIIKTLNQRCPELTVTNNTEKANYVLTLDHEGGKGPLAHRNKIAVFNRDGDDIYSNSTRELGNSVKDACQAMLSASRR
jgi:hypothetical protein